MTFSLPTKSLLIMSTPTSPFDLAFVERWRSLPTELKLGVISFVLSRNDVLDVAILTETARPSTQTQDSEVTNVQLMWFLLEHPEFRDLAIDVLNKKFLIKAPCMLAKTNGFMDPLVPQFPANSTTTYLKRVQIELRTSSSTDWKWFANFAKGKFSFSNF